LASARVTAGKAETTETAKRPSAPITNQSQEIHMFKNIIAVAIAAAFSTAAFAQTPSAAGATKAVEAVKPAAAALP
jgi:hypothetical protein